MTSYGDGIRESIATALPSAISSAIKSYKNFADRDNTDSAKQFKEHHDACKMAIAHVEVLIKLAQWADLPDQDKPNCDRQKVLRGVIANALDEVERYKKTQE